MLPFSEACERNKDAILAVLRTVFAGRGEVLEIGSGTGQHAVYFAAEMPAVTWHPTERLASLPALTARVHAHGGPNLRPATVLDVTQRVWPMERVDAIFTANTLHIMSWQDVVATFEGIGRTLAPSGTLCIYGPFRYQGRYTSPSNGEFDRMLRERDPLSGLREIEAIARLARGVGLHWVADHDLPAFNRLLVFDKEPA